MSYSEKENLIVWQKWSDPLGEDDLESIPEEESSEEAEPVFYEDEDDRSEHETGEAIEFYKKPTRVIMTPMGIIPYTENTASNKIFNFWLGHTNFDITMPVCRIIEQVRGVETLDIFTRYRFRIGIGKLFETSLVINDINNKVYEFLLKE
jgi:hypothetical protein